MRMLCSCYFIQEDDLAYLRDETVWVESRAARLETKEKAALIKFVHDLHGMNINKSFLKASLNKYLNETDFKRLQDRKRRDFVRNIFIAAAIREMILQEETSENMAENRKHFLRDYPFLCDEIGTDEELTYLIRFVRALWFLSRIYKKEGKKTLMMGVATHLQGSDVYIEYTTGGKNTPATARRVRLHEVITGYSPKQRPPRDGNKQRSSDVIVKRGRGRPRKNTLSHPIPMFQDDDMILSSEDFSDDLSLSLDSLDELYTRDDISAMTGEDEDTSMTISDDTAEPLINYDDDDDDETWFSKVCAEFGDPDQ